MTQPMIQGRGSLGDKARLQEYATPVRGLAAFKQQARQVLSEEELQDVLKAAEKRAPSSGKLRDIRKDCGMSEREFAAFLGEGVRTVRDWEAGRSKPPHLAVVLYHILDELS